MVEYVFDVLVFGSKRAHAASRQTSIGPVLSVCDGHWGIADFERARDLPRCKSCEREVARLCAAERGESE